MLGSQSVKYRPAGVAVVAILEMNGVVICNPPGAKLGNATMSWLHAYAHAHRVGAEFLCPKWIGEEIFALPEYGRPPETHEFPRRSEIDLGPEETNVEICGYAQNEKAMIYTKSQALRWLLFKHTPSQIFGKRIDLIWVAERGSTIAHRRVGDFIGYGYPVVSEKSITWALLKFGFNPDDCFTCTEENPTARGPEIAEEIKFLPDFYRMAKAKNLFRGNSSFSWVAGLLCEGRVFAPIVKGLEGGREHEVEFVEGNWPRLSNLNGCGELHVQP